MKILLIRLSSIGDIILVASAIKFIKYNIRCKVDLLVKDKFEKVAELIGADKVLKVKTCQSFIDDIFYLNKIIKQINSERYDIIIDLHLNFKTFFILLFSKANIKSVIKKDVIKRRLMVFFKWFLGRYKSVEEKYIDAVKESLFKVGIKKIKSPKTMKIPREKIKKVVVHIGAKWKLKRWPYFFELVQEISKIPSVKIFITGIKEEIEKNDKLLYIKNNNVLNLIGKTTFYKLAFTIKNADLFIGNDTAAAHLARFYNIPAIVILGPTVAEFGFINHKNFYIFEKKLSCRPCDLHGGNTCPIETFECMNDINPNFIVARVKKLLKVK